MNSFDSAVLFCLLVSVTCLVIFVSLTPYSRVALRNLVAQISKNFLVFIEPDDSLPCWQQPATGPCPEPDESNLHCHIAADYLTSVLILYPRMASFFQNFRLNLCMPFFFIFERATYFARLTFLHLLTLTVFDKENRILRSFKKYIISSPFYISSAIN
jgi:hypothetical protein